MKQTLIFAALAICLIGFSPAVSAQTAIFGLTGQAGSGLLPGNEVPSASSTAFGDAVGITFDSATNQLALNVAWGSGNGFSDLTGNATAMHIHGPADINSNGGVLYNLGSLPGFDNSASNGGFLGTITLSTIDVQTLFDGEMYLNIHTDANPGGELRGNIVSAIPEPSSLAILGIMGSVVGFRRRRR